MPVSGFAKGVDEEVLVFREDLIQQGDDLALQTRNRIDPISSDIGMTKLC
ncbi:hypothetical protein [Murimonas intestini]|nr:hypothetical protein [Murimonas intestini]